MGKPRLIIIIRHAQSEGNRDKAIHQNVPDHRVGLTEEGHEQARQAGEKLRALLREDDTLHFFISPYKRTRETTEGILSTLCSNEQAPSPFQRHHIKVYEEPRIREQDFGNFQPGTDEVERLWRERASYGHFFYRIPNGESGADVYDRVSSFNGSLWRRFSEDRMASVAVLVTHGLCSRIFLMAWYHYSVEFFEDLRNINHCEFLVMKLGKNGRYVLQNQLRRWTDLKRERAARNSISSSSPPQHIPVRRWGSTANAFDDANLPSREKKLPRRQNTADLFKDDDESQEGQISRNHSQKRFDKVPQRAIPEEEEQQQQNPKLVRAGQKESLLTASLKDLTISNEPESSREETATYLGRDGGGSRSGAASPFDLSDEDEESDTNTPSASKEAGNENSFKPSFKPNSLAQALRGQLSGQIGSPDRVMADALGDHSDAEVEQADEEMGIKARERREMEHILKEEVLERTHGGDI